jgi:NAD(P)-dependent dehydrogenase (short-subunit alcohol dehydrogenase family)
VQTIALENADAGVTANVILPGTMDTPANRKSMPGADSSKWLKTQDVTDLILSLAGESGRNLTGLAIPIEGRHG